MGVVCGVIGTLGGGAVGITGGGDALIRGIWSMGDCLGGTMVFCKRGCTLGCGGAMVNGDCCNSTLGSDGIGGDRMGKVGDGCVAGCGGGTGGGGIGGGAVARWRILAICKYALLMGDPYSREGTTGDVEDLVFNMETRSVAAWRR